MQQSELWLVFPLPVHPDEDTVWDLTWPLRSESLMERSHLILRSTDQTSISRSQAASFHQCDRVAAITEVRQTKVASFMGIISVFVRCCVVQQNLGFVFPCVWYKRPASNWATPQLLNHSISQERTTGISQQVNELFLSWLQLTSIRNHPSFTKKSLAMLKTQQICAWCVFFSHVST